VRGLLLIVAVFAALVPNLSAAAGADPPPALALAVRPPPPDNFPIDGKVTAVDAERQTFTVGKRRVQVTPDTRILVGKGFGSFKQIQVGRRVRVVGDGRRAAEVTILGGR
jgi:Domain of unknown function (DUF5666)